MSSTLPASPRTTPNLQGPSGWPASRRPGHLLLAVLAFVASALAKHTGLIWLAAAVLLPGRLASAREEREAIAFIGTAAVGSSPFGVDTNQSGQFGAWFVTTSLLVHLVFTTICILKGKLVTGLVGMPMPTFAFIGSLRLAKPDSCWARRRYDEKKMARAVARFQRDTPSWGDRMLDRFVPSADPPH